MALSPGNRLGPYEIVAPLGAGGMGEVYRARDKRLDRDVAVKVLPANFATDTDRLRRFELEARAAGMLNHPNILAVYDIGSHDGTPYLVTELLEGQTLREQLPVSRRKALEYAKQVCQGLAAAHAKGITHRDLKPENLFVTTDGRVKILDFGLAKVASNDALTLAADPATLPGTPLGTASYMSPEQVRGLPADHRSDIFSLGIVLYEMLCERRPFQRDTAAETMTAILKDDPPSAVGVPPAFEQVLHRCMEKSPEERFQSASDLSFSLGAHSGSEAALPAVRARRSPPWLWLILPLVALGMLLLGYFTGRRKSLAAPQASEVRTQRLTDFEGMEEYPALSPDGKSVAFVAQTGARRHVWIRLIAGGPALQITRDDADHQFPRWAPDSGSLVYFSPPPAGANEGTIWEVSALGGAPRRLASGFGGADLSHDGKRLAFFKIQGNRRKVVVQARDGSSLREVSTLDSGFDYLYPRWSPDDRWIAFQKGYVFNHDIQIAPAEGGPPRSVTSDNTLLSGLAWLPDGSGLVYSTARASPQIYSATFDLWQASLAGGGPRQITFGGASWVDPDVGPRGELVASRLTTRVNIWRYPTDGLPVENARRGVQITRQTGVVLTPSAGPQDKEIVYLSDSGGHANLWISSLATGDARQITFERDPKVNLGVPVWSPDGRNIAFVSTRGKPGWAVGPWLVSPDGSNLRAFGPSAGWACWSPDGKWIYANLMDSVGLDQALVKMPVDGGPPVTVRVDQATRPAVAPDGRTLYYIVERRRETGSPDLEIHVASPENAPGRLLARLASSQVPDWGLVHPVISPDGRWLAVARSDDLTNNLWAVSTADGGFRQVTEFRPRRVSIARRVSWTSDGRFLLAAVAESESDVVLLTGLKY